MRLIQHRQRHSPHDDYAHGGPEDHGHEEIPLPSELMARATGEHPDDEEARTARYVELMVEAGHVQLDADPDDA